MPTNIIITNIVFGINRDMLFSHYQNNQDKEYRPYHDLYNIFVLITIHHTLFPTLSNPHLSLTPPKRHISNLRYHSLSTSPVLIIIITFIIMNIITSAIWNPLLCSIFLRYYHLIFSIKVCHKYFLYNYSLTRFCCRSLSFNNIM